MPHFDGEGIHQFISIRLFDSVPDEVIKKWKLEHSWHDDGNNGERATALAQFLNQYADQGYGSCFLRIPQIAVLTRDTLLFYDHKRYELIEWCIMPNHLQLIRRTDS